MNHAQHASAGIIIMGESNVTLLFWVNSIHSLVKSSSGRVGEWLSCHFQTGMQDTVLMSCRRLGSWHLHTRTCYSRCLAFCSLPNRLGKLSIQVHGVQHLRV